MRKTKVSSTSVVPSSGNVFADLRLPDSVERLIYFLTALGLEVEIVIRKPRSGRTGKIQVTAAVNHGPQPATGPESTHSPEVSGTRDQFPLVRAERVAQFCASCLGAKMDFVAIKADNFCTEPTSRIVRWE